MTQRRILSIEITSEAQKVRAIAHLLRGIFKIGGFNGAVLRDGGVIDAIISIHRDCIGGRSRVPDIGKA